MRLRQPNVSILYILSGFRLFFKRCIRLFECTFLRNGRRLSLARLFLLRQRAIWVKVQSEKYKRDKFRKSPFPHQKVEWAFFVPKSGERSWQAWMYWAQQIFLKQPLWQSCITVWPAANTNIANSGQRIGKGAADWCDLLDPDQG